MRLAVLRRGRNAERLPGIVGVARLDRRTKNLTKRIRPGEIAVVDHVDIDRVSADHLVTCKVAAVVNAAPSISGRYPNLGPEILLAAGIPLLDGVGDTVFGELKEGDVVRLDGDTLYDDRERVLAVGTPQRAPGWLPSSRPSLPTRWSTCSRSGTCSWTGSASRRSGRDSRAGTR
jgi:uncharacterized membrane-anchored protein